MIPQDKQKCQLRAQGKMRAVPVTAPLWFKNTTSLSPRRKLPPGFRSSAQRAFGHKKPAAELFCGRSALLILRLFDGEVNDIENSNSNEYPAEYDRDIDL